MNLNNFVLLKGACKMCMAAVVELTGATLSLPITCPSKLKLPWLKLLLIKLMITWSFVILWNKHLRVWICLPIFTDNNDIVQVTVHVFKPPNHISVIYLWKVPGASRRPKSIPVTDLSHQALQKHWWSLLSQTMAPDDNFSAKQFWFRKWCF